MHILMALIFMDAYFNGLWLDEYIMIWKWNLFIYFRDLYGYGFSQWEMVLQCNVVSHWLSLYLIFSSSTSHRICPWFCCALFCCGYITNALWIDLIHLPISFRVTSLPLEQSYDYGIHITYPTGQSYDYRIHITYPTGQSYDCPVGYVICIL